MGEPAVPLFEARSVSKYFGDVAANSDVSIAIHAGEKHALLGENGAGKSTLVKMIYGVLQPSGGALLWRGQEIRIASPAAARALGIGMVFQHFSVFEALTVAENIALALPGSRSGVARRITSVSSRYGLEIEPGRPVHTLSAGEKQRVEIVRCLLREPRLLIMDEPTSVLTPQESGALFETLNRLAADGCAVLYISHKLAEVTALCDVATILRGGRVVETCDPRQHTPASMAELMVGAGVSAVERGSALPGSHRQDVRLTVDRLTLESESETGVPLRDVSLSVRGGEIHAIAGIAGEGQAELMAALTGERRAGRPEAVVIDGRALGRRGPSGRRRARAAFVPEERLGHAAVPEMTLSDNVVLTHHKAEGLAPAGWIGFGRARRTAAAIRKLFDVRAAGRDPVARALSGGNLQKFVVGREMQRAPGVLVVNQPTWGVDAGAAAAIRKALIRLAREGAAVLVISQDLDEIFEIADRVSVMFRGQLSAPRPAAGLSREAVGLMMAGEDAP